MDYDKLCMGCMNLKEDDGTCPACGYIQTDQVHDPRCLPPGTILNGQYLVGKVLGQGGFGITYIAFDLNLETRVAIKEYMPDGLVTRTLGENTVAAYSSSKLEHFEYGMGKFLEEAKMMAKFNDVKSIVSVRNFFKENGTAYFVMDFIEGTNLAQYLQNRGGKIPLDEALAFMTEVIDALAVVHRNGMLHRDISPDNIYLTRDGTIKLLDFGAARYAMGEQSKSLSIILKPGYAPEEQYRSKGVQGAWTDIYATAATLYRMITGQLPPESMDRLNEDELIPPSKLGVPIDAHVENAILKALAVKAENRFQTMEDFRKMLIDGVPETKPEPKAPSAPVKNHQEPVKTSMAPVSAPVKPQPVQQSAQQPVSIQKSNSSGKKVLIVAVIVFIIAAGILTGVLLSNRKIDDTSGNVTNVTTTPTPTRTVGAQDGATITPSSQHIAVGDSGNQQHTLVDPVLSEEDEKSRRLILDTIAAALNEQDLILPLMNSEEVTEELILRNKALPVVQQYQTGFFEISRDAKKVNVVQGNRKTSDGYIRIGGNDRYYSIEYNGLSRDNVVFENRYIKTYDRRYQITVPGKWQELNVIDFDVDLSAGIEEEIKYTIGMIEPMYGRTLTLSEMVQTIEESLGINLNEEESGYTSVKLSGFEGIRFEMTGDVEGINLTYLFTVINAEDDIVQIISWTATDMYADYRDEYIQVHDSFQVNRKYFD